MSYFRYGKKEMDYLSGKDSRMAALIAATGKIKRPVTPDLFEALISSIIAQQISAKAARTVFSRLNTLAHSMTPEHIDVLSQNEIQQCGMSFRKAHYIKEAASAIASGEIKLSAFRTMDDKDIIRQLTTLPGIGVWTVEMLLLHALQRPNVFSYNDLVVRKNLMHLQGLTKLDKPTFETYRQRYTPYCSVAMLYLWYYDQNL